MLPIWVTELAAHFWDLAGPPPPFPRDLAGPARDALPVRVVSRPHLTLDGVRGWLARAGVGCPADEPDRPLRGALFVRAGAGFLFVDAADPPDERRFSLAHEVAHFLRDCDAVRRAVAAKLGPAGLEVLDGKRPPTPGERLHAVLRGVPLGAHVHLLGRDDDGRPRTAAEQQAEAAADRLAFELLAPAELFEDAPGVGGVVPLPHVRASGGREPPGSDAEPVRDAGQPGGSRPPFAKNQPGDRPPLPLDPGPIRDAVRRRLVTEFGLPPGPAADYARLLAPDPPADPFFERIRKLW